MATEPKPDLPSADECVRRAWQAAQEAQSRELPMSSQAAFWQESQAWSLLGLALRGAGPELVVPWEATPGSPAPYPAVANVQAVPQPPTPAPVARRKPGPKPEESADDVVARLKAEWEQES